ncbi:MAG TPA: hypothetical protein VEF72_05685 [Mycobacterium sp.]|nr:hypothetical protein [Mycobacterium sp.]
MEENRPARAKNPSIFQGHDYEYDEAHDMPAGPLLETLALHRADSPPEVNLGKSGDYGYDEARDFAAQ